MGSEESGESHYRLVTLGGSGVGKSAILKRFLFGTYADRHRPTVEDLYSREFDISGTQLKVTFLDTAGDMQFPAMRRLSIANGQAFLLVYSVDNEESFRIMKQCFQEIRDQKTDFQELPIMIVGNKCDLSEDRHKVSRESVNEWLFCELPKVKAKILEVSAKDNTNIRELFRSFLQLAGISIVPTETTPHALKRRFSTHVSMGRQLRFNSSLSPQREQQAESSPESSSTQQSSSQKSTKPRSRSLIRRTSKKSSKHKDGKDGKDGSQNTPGCNDGDCLVS